MCCAREVKTVAILVRIHGACSALYSIHCRVSSEWLVLTTIQELLLVLMGKLRPSVGGRARL